MSDLVDRPTELARLQALLEEFPVVGVLGARQVGKTTLAHAARSTRARSAPSPSARVRDADVTTFRWRHVMLATSVAVDAR